MPDDYLTEYTRRLDERLRVLEAATTSPAATPTDAGPCEDCIVLRAQLADAKRQARVAEHIARARLAERDEALALVRRMREQQLPEQPIERQTQPEIVVDND